MSYYNVRGQKVLGWQKTPWKAGTFDEVDEPFMTSMDAHEQIMLNVQGLDGKSNPKFLEREQLRRAYLEQQYDALGKAKFIKKWVEFSFEEKDAAEFTCLVIDNYFRINKNGFLSRSPGFECGGKEHYMKTNFDAWGDEFYINLEYESRKKEKWWYNKPQPNILAFQINLRNIRSLQGTLERFTVVTTAHQLRFSWHIAFEELSSEA